MKYKHYLLNLKYYKTLLTAVFIMSLSSCKNEEKEPKTPNVLFFSVDDLRPEVNSYGKAQIISPNIDKLANDSTVFARAYCNVPVCGASRASMLN